MSCLCNYFLIDFVYKWSVYNRSNSKRELFSTETRFFPTMMNPEKIFILDPRQYTTSGIKRGKVSIWHPLTLLKSFQMYHKDLF